MSKHRTQIVRVPQKATGVKKYRTPTEAEAAAEHARIASEAAKGLKPKSIAKVRKARAEPPKGEPSKGFVSSVYGRKKF